MRISVAIPDEPGIDREAYKKKLLASGWVEGTGDQRGRFLRELPSETEARDKLRKAGLDPDLLYLDEIP
jgi:hypothetical protein